MYLVTLLVIFAAGITWIYRILSIWLASAGNAPLHNEFIIILIQECIIVMILFVWLILQQNFNNSKIYYCKLKSV